MKKHSEYTKQAETFLHMFGLKFRAIRGAATCPLFCDGKHIHKGDKYKITIRRVSGGSFSFNFWNSHKDMCDGMAPSAYDALSCISTDAFCPDTLEEFCAEFGYDSDSRKAEKTFKLCSKFAVRVRSFFTDTELSALQEIN